MATTDPRPASKRVVRVLLCGAITRDADSFRDRALSRGLLIINKNLRVRQKPVSRSRKFSLRSGFRTEKTALGRLAPASYGCFVSVHVAFLQQEEK